MLSKEFHLGAQNLLPGPTRILAAILKPFKMITVCSNNLNFRYSIPQRQPTGIPWFTRSTSHHYLQYFSYTKCNTYFVSYILYTLKISQTAKYTQLQNISSKFLNWYTINIYVMRLSMI